MPSPASIFYLVLPSGITEVRSGSIVRGTFIHTGTIAPERIRSYISRIIRRRNRLPGLDSFRPVARMCYLQSHHRLDSMDNCRSWDAKDIPGHDNGILRYLCAFSLFPGWDATDTENTSLQCLMDIPLRFYLGTTPASEIFLLGLLQLAWTAFFIVVGLRLMALAMKRVVVQGG